MQNSNPAVNPPEIQYQKTTSLAHRKAYGQVFTPVQVARFMTHWITSKVPSGKLLDPALGLGIFFRQLVDLEQTDYILDGFELDPNLATEACRLFSTLPLNLKCQEEDFLLDQGAELYDGIICNPPYIHFQDYQKSLQLIQTFNEKYQLQLNGFSNIYALFLIKSLHQLKSSGRAAFILPSEFLNADYGRSIKEWLIQHRKLAHLIIFDSAIQLFEGFLTTSAILLFEGQEQESLQIVSLRDLSELAELEGMLAMGCSGVADSQGNFHKLSDLSIKINNSTPIVKKYRFDQLDPSVKWKHYYSDLKYNFHLVTGEPNLSGHLVPFETYASTRRGIATGANHFFTLTQAEVEQWQINQQYLSPCVTRASHLPKQVFTEDDFRQLVAGGKNVFLLNLRDQEVDPKLEAYLAWGESQGYHTRYLTRHRNPWYRMEPATSADLLVKTFGRKPAIFIQNQTQVLNLTCFHGIYFNELGRQYQNLIFLYLLTDLAREIFEGQKRDYGLGLGKFEPNDIKQALVPDFAQLTAEDQEQLTELYQLYIAGLSSKAEEAGLAKEQLLPVSEVVQRAERVFLKYWVKS